MNRAKAPTSKTTTDSESTLGGERFFKQAFLHAAIGLALVDLDGRFSYTNPAYSKITGYTPSELRKMTIGSLMAPEDKKANALLKQQMLSREIPGYILEKRYIRKDGSRVWVKSSVSLNYDNDGNPLHLVGLTEDIDERHKAEEALKESEARFRFMAEYMPPKVYTATPKGVIDYLSPQWMTYTGISSNEMNYEEWNHAVHPDDLKANVASWNLSVRTGKPYYFEQRLRRADGTYRWHVNRAHPMRDSEGHIIKWIGSATDIEELRQSRDLKTRLQTLAEQREQLIAMNTSKDEFIMLASHQLRTPATGVKQYLGLLLEGFSDPITASQRATLQAAYDSNERQLKIVDDLLRVARVDAGQILLTKTSCDLVACIRDVIAEQRSIFSGRKQKIIFKPAQRAATTLADVELLLVVFENLLDNASKYSFEGTTTTIELRKDHGFFHIQFKDSGVGISKDDQQKLFQKFSRIINPLSDTASGTGLGLYWARKIIDLHGGTLDVVSKPARGSTFSIVLPISRAKKTVGAKTQAAV
jgi:PAS domain S-box-containing protein